MSCGVNAIKLEKMRQELIPILEGIKVKLFENSIRDANRQIYRQFKVEQAKMILKIANEIFGDSIAVAFSGGKDSLVALHLALEVLGNDIKVIYNNTTVEFPETIKYVLDLTEAWNLNLHITRPEKPFFSVVREKGWATHENRWCCRPYKDEPAREFMIKNGIVAEITGTVRTESIYRRSITPFRMPKREPLIIRIHPIYDWNQWEVWTYIKEKKLPYNPLYDKGYRRIGCWCCPLNGPSHYKRLMKTHPHMFRFLKKFTPTHPKIKNLI